ncbi:MAG: response regulator, partial [Candidatus Eremiobacterota bacterium]
MSETVRVLVLEDDAGMRDMITYVLEQEGYQVQAAARGAEAVSLAARQEFDLVIADIRMEGMDGLEALQRVREQQPQVRSLVVTGYSTEADSIRAIRLGVGDYLKKPFDFKDFLGSVRRLVSARRHEAARRQMENRLRASLLRSVEALARLLDGMNHPGRPARGLVETARLAGRLAEALGLGEESVQTASLAALLASVACMEGVPFEPAPEELPAGVALVLRHVEERWDGSGGPDGLSAEQIPIESRVVALALGDAQEPGRFDPRVVATLEHLERSPFSRNAAWEQARYLRGLLSLARALEEARDSDGARQAFREIALTELPCPETIEAHLGLARLTQDSQEAASEARRAAELASLVGPSTAAHAFLRAGQILRDGALLEQAALLCRDLRKPAGEALAILGGRILAGTAVDAEVLLRSLNVLLAPEHAWELARAAPWLLPFLLEQQAVRSVPLVERALAQLARDVPREFDRPEGLSPAARSAAVRSLVQAGGPVADRILERLSQDPDPGVRSTVQATWQRQPGHHKPPVLRIFSLGPLEVYRGQDRVSDKSWRSQKGRWVFAYLAAHKGLAVSEDALVDAFWPDDFEKGKRNLYWYSSILRACLRPEGWPDDLDYILRTAGCLQLNPDLP